ncbi:MAG: hypothetical protein ACFFCD_11085 [Promethearchaeota archaeon]
MKSNLKVTCPKCGKKESLDISKEEFQKLPPGMFILSKTIVHEDHIVVYDIDPDLNVRRAYTSQIDKISAMPPSVEEVPSSELFTVETMIPFLIEKFPYLEQKEQKYTEVDPNTELATIFMLCQDERKKKEELDALCALHVPVWVLPYRTGALLVDTFSVPTTIETMTSLILTDFESMLSVPEISDYLSAFTRVENFLADLSSEKYLVYTLSNLRYLEDITELYWLRKARSIPQFTELPFELSKDELSQVSATFDEAFHTIEENMKTLPTIQTLISRKRNEFTNKIEQETNKLNNKYDNILQRTKENTDLKIDAKKKEWDEKLIELRARTTRHLDETRIEHKETLRRLREDTDRQITMVLEQKGKKIADTLAAKVLNATNLLKTNIGSTLETLSNRFNDIRNSIQGQLDEIKAKNFQFADVKDILEIQISGLVNSIESHMKDASKYDIKELKSRIKDGGKELSTIETDAQSKINEIENEAKKKINDLNESMERVTKEQNETIERLMKEQRELIAKTEVERNEMLARLTDEQKKQLSDIEAERDSQIDELISISKKIVEKSNHLVEFINDKKEMLLEEEEQFKKFILSNLLKFKHAQKVDIPIYLTEFVDPTQDTSRLLVFPPCQYISMAKGSEKLINKNLRVYATDSFYDLKEKLEKLLISKKQLNEAVKKALNSQNLLSKEEFIAELKKGLEASYQNGRIKDKTLKKFTEIADTLIKERI